MTEVAVSDPVEPLILDLLDWIGPRSRPYAEVLEAWRTSCPRLPVWEEANQRGFIVHFHEPGQAARVAISPLGLAQLEARRLTSLIERGAMRSASGALATAGGNKSRIEYRVSIGTSDSGRRLPCQSCRCSSG